MDKERFLEILPNPAAKLPEITDVKPLVVNAQNYGTLAKQEYQKLRDRIKKGLLCSALGDRKVAGTLSKHLKETHGIKRDIPDIINRVSLMPYIIPIIEKGNFTEKREGSKGASYKLTGIADGNKISVILVEDPKTRLLYLSIFEDTSKVGESLNQIDDPTTKGYFENSSPDCEQRPATQGHILIIPDVDI
jgi:hypothetical protein